MLQQLLADTVLEAEVAISMSLSMAGALADQASSSSSSSSKTEDAEATTAAAGAPGSGNTAATGSSACQLLELAAQLTQYCRQQALQLAQQQAPADSPNAAAVPAEQSPVVQHIVGVQQQVLLRLGQAYLATQQHAKALECVVTLQGLSVGCMPVPGLVQLSILALIGQGKLLPAAAQLVAWLKQGSQLAAAAACGPNQDPHARQQQQQQSTEEACAVVDAFLQALHEHASRTDSMHAAAAAGLAGSSSAAAAGLAGSSSAAAAAAAGGVDVQQLVQQVADAAAERCQGQPGVAVAVVLRLLENQVHLALVEARVLRICTVSQIPDKLWDTAVVHVLWLRCRQSSCSKGQLPCCCPCRCVLLVCPACVSSSAGVQQQPQQQPGAAGAAAAQH
jgi:hypothetical protein